MLVGVSADLEPVSETKSVVAFTQPEDVDEWLRTVTSQITLFFQVLRSDIQYEMPEFE